jgi:hypothetical protein
MTRKLRRALWIMIVLPTVLTAAILLTAPQNAQSCGQSRCGYEFYYYSDASHTTLVGWRFWDCDCDYFSWGTTSFYREVIENECCG